MGVELSDEAVHSTCALQISVVMDYQFAVLSHADVQLEHVTHFTRGLENLQCVFWALEASPAMSDAEERRRLDELVEGFAMVALPAVKDVGQAEEEGRYDQIPSRDDEPQPLKVHNIL